MPHSDPSEKLTVGQFLAWAEARMQESDVFYGHGTDNAWDEAILLLTHTLDVSPYVDQSFAETVISSAQKEQLLKLVEQRIKERIPAAYLTGQSWFCGLRFAVNRDVLIPRSPIGELVEQYFSPWVNSEPKRILDLCTGSGCIGIASAYAFPDSEVVISDISEPALAVARQNIQHHKLQDRVTAVQSDLFDNLQGEQFDLIISNSPYVDAEDFWSMPEEYQHEPTLALASGDDGLDFTRRLLTESTAYLQEAGTLVAEVGNSWVALEQAYPQLPFAWVEFERGGHGVFVLDKNQLSA